MLEERLKITNLEDRFKSEIAGGALTEQLGMTAEALRLAMQQEERMKMELTKHGMDMSAFLRQNMMENQMNMNQSGFNSGPASSSGSVPQSPKAAGGGQVSPGFSPNNKGNSKPPEDKIVAPETPHGNRSERGITERMTEDDDIAQKDEGALNIDLSAGQNIEAEEESPMEEEELSQHEREKLTAKIALQEQQKRAQEQQKLVEQQKLLEQQKILEQQKLQEQQRIQEQQRHQEQKRLQEQQRIQEQQRLQEQQRSQEQQRIQEQQRAHEQQQRLIEQQRAMEQQRLLEQQRAHEQQQRLMEQQRAHEQQRNHEQHNTEQYNHHQQQQFNNQPPKETEAVYHKELGGDAVSVYPKEMIEQPPPLVYRKEVGGHSVSIFPKEMHGSMQHMHQGGEGNYGMGAQGPHHPISSD